MTALRLGVNVDHVATVRNARGGALPDPVRAAVIAIEAGADGITAHLREDRRHIHDDDMRRLKATITKPLNFEMAATEEMLDIALLHPAARLLPRAGEAHRTDHRGRPRRGQRLPRAKALRRRARAGGHPRLDVHRALGRGLEGERRPRRAGRRTAHRRLVRRAGARRFGPRRLRVRPPAGRRRPDPGARPRMPRRPRPRLRFGANHRGPAANRRAQHRPFPRWRSDFRWPRRDR